MSMRIDMMLYHAIFTLTSFILSIERRNGCAKLVIQRRPVVVISFTKSLSIAVNPDIWNSFYWPDMAFFMFP